MQTLKILNITQHKATPEQVADGVFELTESDKKQVQDYLTFFEIPNRDELLYRADLIAKIVAKYDTDAVMIGGAPYFMPYLEIACKHAKRYVTEIKVLYSFSKRDSIDIPQADGTVKKVAIFKHSGWVEA